MKEWKDGQCHCGAIRFKVRSEFLTADDCNCSMCFMKATPQHIVPKEDFELLAGQESLALYQFNTRKARHHFCKTCGISPFYIPRSHPEGVSVNLRCVEGVDLSKVRLVPFNGQEWEKSVGDYDRR